MFYFLFFLLSGALGRILFVKGAIQVLWYCIVLYCIVAITIELRRPSHCVGHCVRSTGRQPTRLQRLDDWATRFGQLGDASQMLNFLHFSSVFEMLLLKVCAFCLVGLLLSYLEQINCIVASKVTTVKHLHIKFNFTTVCIYILRNTHASECIL